MGIVRLIGIYNADGGIVGEVRYVIGHLLGTTECALCDITHSPVRRKPQWDAMVADLGIHFSTLHRNELSAELSDYARGVTLPCVVAELDSGQFAQAMTQKALANCNGSVDLCAKELRKYLEAG